MQIKIGITGQNGFVGQHLYRRLELLNTEFVVVDFQRKYFNDVQLLDKFVGDCDVIVHLAGLNRHEDQDVIYNTNIDLTRKLVASLGKVDKMPHVIFSSSSQEEKDNLYGKSKAESRIIFENWAEKTGAKFNGLIIPNVFGPFGVPFYNSVIATFCHQLTRDQIPEIVNDSVVNLIYIDELIDIILKCCRGLVADKSFAIEPTKLIKVSELLVKLKDFKLSYFDNNNIPLFENTFDLNLFNTFRSYIDLKEYYPRKYKINEDDRGIFVELIKINSGGQVSFSTTKSGIVRGNHFHTRKIERFSVIKGKALIQLRKVGTKEVCEFELDGKNAGFVDMPIWYTHNIKNIGEEELLTVFWINEFFNPEDADTYFEIV